MSAAPVPAIVYPPITTNPASIAVPDPEVALVILGRQLTRGQRDKLRNRGEWPPIAFYIGRKAYVLRSDIETFIEARKAAAPEIHAQMSERGRQEVNADRKSVV